MRIWGRVAAIQGATEFESSRPLPHRGDHRSGTILTPMACLRVSVSPLELQHYHLGDWSAMVSLDIAQRGQMGPCRGASVGTRGSLRTQLVPSLAALANTFAPADFSADPIRL